MWLPNWFPTPLNKLLTAHWAAADRLKKADYEQIGKACRVYGVRFPECRRRVDIHMVLPKGQRAWDEDSPWKVCLDGLVAAGALKNDSPEWCRKGSTVYARAMDDRGPGTLILLEDLRG